MGNGTSTNTTAKTMIITAAKMKVQMNDDDKNQKNRWVEETIDGEFK